MTLRDYFAVHASDEDIKTAMHEMPRVETVVEKHDGTKSVVMALPANARQLARYMHADAMLKARNA